MCGSSELDTYPVDVTITTYRRVFVTAASPEDAQRQAARIVRALPEDARARLPLSPAAGESGTDVLAHDAADPVDAQPDPAATYMWWERVSYTDD